MPSTCSAATADADLRQRLLGAVPALRAFAHSLAGDDECGDDLVQNTLLRAWAGLDETDRGGDATAWLFTILHRLFHAECRPLPLRATPGTARSAPGSAGAPAEAARFREALRRLPDTQREALILVGAQHFSYGEAAAICGVAVGTLKSRVSRARARLAAELEERPRRR